MTFNSFGYFLFLPVIYLVYHFTGDRYRWLVLLGASYGFYASFKSPYLLVALLTVTLISFGCGLRLSAHLDEAKRKKWFLLGTSSCMSVLVLFKCLSFIGAKSIFGLSNSLSLTLISVGVSYYTIQAISYLADVYLEIEKPEHHFGYYALYLAFFPKLLQGPIERAGDLLPQLKKPFQYNYGEMRFGMFLFTWGLFKKVVVADRLALFADQVYNNIHVYTGLPLVIGTYAYAFQLYFDFSAYTDMARGTGRIFGVNLTENFNRPYMATSVADFWRRWHISFSRWLLDYIFKPLQLGWRGWGTAGTAIALITTFMLSGIWHGAASGFVIWGLLHGAYLAVSIFYRPYQKKFHIWVGIAKSKWLRLWQVAVTFNLVCFAWIFFRANSLSDAIYVVSGLRNLFTTGVGDNFRKFIKLSVLLGQSNRNAIILAVSLCIFFMLNGGLEKILKSNIFLRWALYLALIIACIDFGVSSEIPFLYLQF